MNLGDVFAAFLAGSRIRRSSWINPLDVKEAYLQLVEPGGTHKKTIYMYSGGTQIARVVQSSLGAEDIIADDWELV